MFDFLMSFFLTILYFSGLHDYLDEKSENDMLINTKRKVLFSIIDFFIIVRIINTFDNQFSIFKITS